MKCNGGYSRNCLPKRKNRAHVINFVEYKSIETHWIDLYVTNNDVTYLDSFGVEHIPKETKKFLGNKNIRTNIYGMQAYNLIICQYFCTGFL